jgi:HD superfamily phosphohydrolase
MLERQNGPPLKIEPEEYSNPKNWRPIYRYYPQSRYVGLGASREDFPDVDIFLYLPLSNLGIEFTEDPDDKLNSMVGSLPSLSRLQHINQLSQKRAHPSSVSQELFIPLNHNRYHHTLLVAAVGNQILFDNNLAHLGSLYTAAALLHDVATPAYGDAAKKVDPLNLDEEDFWQEAITVEEKLYLQELGLSLQDIDDVIHNKGMLGELLNVADRIAYVTLDAEKISEQTVLTQQPDADLPLRKDIQNAGEIGEIYKHIKIDGDNVYCDDINLAEQFLRLRANLFSKFYLYAPNQSKDSLISLLAKPLYTMGILTAESLRKMDDYELSCILREHYLPNGFLDGQIATTIAMWQPKYKSFTTNSERDEIISDLQACSYNIIGTEKLEKPFNTGTSLLVAHNSVIMPFSEAEPEIHNELVTLSNSVHQSGQVFYIQQPEYIDPYNDLELTIATLVANAQS